MIGVSWALLKTGNGEGDDEIQISLQLRLRRRAVSDADMDCAGGRHVRTRAAILRLFLLAAHHQQDRASPNYVITKVSYSLAASRKHTEPFCGAWASGNASAPAWPHAAQSPGFFISAAKSRSVRPR